MKHFHALCVSPSRSLTEAEATCPAFLRVPHSWPLAQSGGSVGRAVMLSRQTRQTCTRKKCHGPLGNGPAGAQARCEVEFRHLLRATRGTDTVLTVAVQPRAPREPHQGEVPSPGSSRSPPPGRRRAGDGAEGTRRAQWAQEAPRRAVCGPVTGVASALLPGRWQNIVTVVHARGPHLVSFD